MQLLSESIMECYSNDGCDSKREVDKNQNSIVVQKYIDRLDIPENSNTFSKTGMHLLDSHSIRNIISHESKLSTFPLKRSKFFKDLNHNTKREKSVRQEVTSKYFKTKAWKRLTKPLHTIKNKPNLKILKKDLNPAWKPPKSPFNLIEEHLFDNRWALLVSTIFLNKTRSTQARPAIAKFLENFDGPRAVVSVKPAELEDYFDHIGLKKRAFHVWKMSYDFLYKNCTDVGELYGIGKYGEDAFNMFCLGNMDLEPRDRFLKMYKEWYEKGEHFGGVVASVT